MYVLNVQLGFIKTMQLTQRLELLSVEIVGKQVQKLVMMGIQPQMMAVLPTDLQWMLAGCELEDRQPLRMYVLNASLDFIKIMLRILKLE